MKVKLCDVFDLQMGKTPSRDNLEYWNGKHKWVAIGDLGNTSKYISHTKECISDAGVAESGIKPVPAGTVIMSFKLSIGKTAITTEEIYTNEAIMAFIDKKVCPIDADYIYHLFSGMDWSKGSNRAVMGATLNKSTLSQKTINIPDINEQRSVTCILDKLDDLIFLRKQQLAKLDELVKARFVEMFGDPINNTLGFPTKTLGEICLLKAGITTPADAIFDYDAEHQIPCYGGNGIRGYVNESTQHGTYPIIGRQGALCGNVQFAQGNFHATEHAVLVTPRQKTNTYWLFYLLKYMNLYRYHTGAAQPGLAVKTLNTVHVPVVDLKLQDEFSSLVTKINEQKLTIQQSLDKLKVLKKSLMQEYFG